ncbi:hypothetical protein HYR99_25040 [Candidatus Poribacteria bacterium]|nr:hypothetical protein [Candidatus Poribacteria bacterium]
MFTYSLVSTAISDDRRRLRGGMRRLAEIAHKHGIPISWAMHADSARAFASDLTEWHESYGDEPLLMLDIAPLTPYPSPQVPRSEHPAKRDLGEGRGERGEAADLSHPLQSAEHIVTMREKLPDYILSEWSKVQREMAWASRVVAGAAQKNHVLLYALHQVGFKGLWGYRWEERRSGGTDDWGCPFGFFYPSEERHNSSGYPASQIVGIPYAAINLRRGHREGGGGGIHALPAEPQKSQMDREEREGEAPAEPFTDLHAQILNGTAQRTFDHYVANARWNHWLAYVQHIDAAGLTGLSSEYLEQLDAYFAYVCRQPETQVALLSDAVNDYRLGCNQTQPTYLLIDPDSETLREGEAPRWLGAGSAEPAPPAPSGKSTLFYYDAECQLIFEEEQMEPIDMKNYVSPPVKSRYCVEFNLPRIEKFRPSRARNQLRMQFELESTKAMPYGFAIWGNHTGLTLAKSDAHTVTWVGDRLLFIRVELQTGKNDIKVVLTI